MDEARARLEVERATVLARLAALTGDYDSVVAASLDTNADDEHDPEGATIAFERSQIGALVAQAASTSRRWTVPWPGSTTRRTAPASAAATRSRPAASRPGPRRAGAWPARPCPDPARGTLAGPSCQVRAWRAVALRCAGAQLIGRGDRASLRTCAGKRPLPASIPAQARRQAEDTHP